MASRSPRFGLPALRWGVLRPSDVRRARGGSRSPDRDRSRACRSRRFLHATSLRRTAGHLRTTRAISRGNRARSAPMMQRASHAAGESGTISGMRTIRRGGAGITRRLAWCGLVVIAACGGGGSGGGDDAPGPYESFLQTCTAARDYKASLGCTQDPADLCDRDVQWLMMTGDTCRDELLGWWQCLQTETTCAGGCPTAPALDCTQAFCAANPTNSACTACLEGCPPPPPP